MTMFDHEKLDSVKLQTEPFEYLIVPGFLSRESCSRVNQDFPHVAGGGSFPLASLNYGTAFKEFSTELLSTEMRTRFGNKFGMDLTGKPPTLTVRGMTRHKDGQVHVDSVTKLITVLIYLNDTWESDGGRLRLLRSKDINDVIAEVPPDAGTLVAFRCRDNAWHGHLPFVGERRSIQLNWVVDEVAARNSAWRHRLSSFVKRLGTFTTSQQ